MLDRLGRVDCPILVGVGELDPITRWRPPVGSPPPSPEGTARLAVFERAGHFTWKDIPERYWPLLLEFVAGAGR